MPEILLGYVEKGEQYILSVSRSVCNDWFALALCFAEIIT